MIDLDESFSGCSNGTSYKRFAALARCAFVPPSVYGLVATVRFDRLRDALDNLAFQLGAKLSCKGQWARISGVVRPNAILPGAPAAAVTHVIVPDRFRSGNGQAVNRMRRQ